MSRCCICLASGRGHFDLLISTDSSARQSLTYCHWGPFASLSLTAVTTCALLAPSLIVQNTSASVQRDYIQSLMPLIANNQPIITGGHMRISSLYLINTCLIVEHHWNLVMEEISCWSSGIIRPSGSIRALCLLCKCLFWLASKLRSLWFLSWWKLGQWNVYSPPFWWSVIFAPSFKFQTFFGLFGHKRLWSHLDLGDLYLGVYLYIDPKFTFACTFDDLRVYRAKNDM